MIYLAQTDTTAGFLSKDFRAINALKQRALATPCLICVAEFRVLKNFVRVPQTFKNRLRKARKTSFLYPNTKALRVVQKEYLHSLSPSIQAQLCIQNRHFKFLQVHGWLYSSSANMHKQGFNSDVAKASLSEVRGIVVDENLYEGKASALFKLNRTKRQKIR